MKTLPGYPYPLGATWDGKGVNFALFSKNATAVELCLFNTVHSKNENRKITLTEKTNHVWHIYIPDARPGWLYGYRVHGPYDPKKGDRFNPHKLLVDPYAKWIARPLRWYETHYGYPLGHPSEDLVMDERDNAPFAPLCAVVDTTFSWGDDRPPKTPWYKTVLYEAHVSGMTMKHPDVPSALRGTYAGLASEPIIDHLNRLGVTAVELMPIHQHVDEHPLLKQGLKNYWGYNTLAFFAPDTRYQSGTMNVVDEFKSMVCSFHAAGIEVILDVVYNHTADGNHLGPTLSLKGIDNREYFRLTSDNPRIYTNFTGCGNSLNTRSPHVLALIMDSLRYWATEMHVDGFRFDLASALARDSHGFDRFGSFFNIIQQDPILSQLKLIAEPWDMGEGGYQVGNFPAPWAEWNAKYRDTVRRFWKGEEGQVAEIATRLSGSSDLYGWDGRQTYASINYITSHDGFTLQDLVSYNQKHNAANCEGNRDGTDHNMSSNFGVEGPTKNPRIRGLREKQKRNFMATLFFSQGVPMICAGDEMGRTQKGNNNAYCQDNEISWIHWALDKDQTEFLRFVQKVIAIRKKNPVLHRRHFFQGKGTRVSEMKDISWFTEKGREMTHKEWHAKYIRCLGVRLSGEAINERDERGNKIVGDTILLLMNADPGTIPFVLPANKKQMHWVLMLDTAKQENGGRGGMARGGRTYALEGGSLALFRQVLQGEAGVAPSNRLQKGEDEKAEKRNSASH